MLYHVIGELCCNIYNESFLGSWEKAPGSFETVETIRAAKQHNIAEDMNLRLGRYENPKYRMCRFVLVHSLEI
jgi:hypothetical protein